MKTRWNRLLTPRKRIRSLCLRKFTPNGLPSRKKLPSGIRTLNDSCPEVAASTSRLILNAPSCTRRNTAPRGTSLLSSCRVKKQPLTRAFEKRVVYTSCESRPAIDDPTMPYVALFSDQKRREEKKTKTIPRDKLCVSTPCNVLPLGTQRALSPSLASESLAEIIPIAY